MAIVTIELRHVLDMDDFDLFDFDYVCDDAGFKSRLEQAIKDRFYFDEIGVETIDRFKWEFRTMMQRIMPYYNQLYNTTLFDGDHMTTYKLKETMDASNTGTQGIAEQSNVADNYSEGNTGTQHITVEDDEDIRSSDYPQHLNPDNDVLSGQQKREAGSTQTRTDALQHTHDQTTEQTKNQTRTDNLKQEHQKIIEGYTGISYSDLLKKHRESLLRITSMIISELKPLFIMVY